MAAAQLRGTEQPGRGEGRGGCWWEGEGVPTLILSFCSGKKEGGPKGEGSDRLLAKGPVLHVPSSQTAEDSHHFLSAGPALPVFGDRR